MTTGTARPMNPDRDAFRGEGFALAAKRLFHATRPKFFPASVLPVIAGTAWGVAMSNAFGLAVFLLGLFATMCVHAAANVLNDVSDDEIGTDPRNEARIYPYTGGSRFIQTGILDRRRMTRFGIALLAAAALAGLLLMGLRGPLVLAFGFAGVLLAVIYSFGPLRLSALGLGEMAVAVAFGILPVSGAAWLQGSALDTSLLLFSLPISAWVAAILLINGVPDMDADRASGKYTLPVRLGNGGTSAVYLALHAAAVVAVLVLTVQGTLPLLAPLVPAALMILAVRAASAIRAGVAEREALAKGIEATLAVHTIGALWLTGCAIYLWWMAG